MISSSLKKSVFFLIPLFIINTSCGNKSQSFKFKEGQQASLNIAENYSDTPQNSSEDFYAQVLALSKSIRQFELEKILLEQNTPEVFGTEFNKFSAQAPEKQNLWTQNKAIKQLLFKEANELYSLLKEKITESPHDPYIPLALGILKTNINSSFSEEFLNKDGLRFLGEIIENDNIFTELYMAELKKLKIELYVSSVENFKESIRLKPNLYVAQHELALSYLSSEELIYLIDGLENMTELEVHEKGWEYVKKAILLLEDGIKNAKTALESENNQTKKQEIKSELSGMMVNLGKQLDWRPSDIAYELNKDKELENTVRTEELQAKALSLFQEAFELTPERPIAAIYYINTQLLEHYHRRGGYYDGDSKLAIMTKEEAQKVNWDALIKANNVLLSGSPDFLFENININDFYLYRQALILEIHRGVAQGQINQDNIDTVINRAKEFIQSIGYDDFYLERIIALSEKYKKDAEYMIQEKYKKDDKKTLNTPKKSDNPRPERSFIIETA